MEATERGGKARVVLDGGALELPGVFEQPLVPFDRFQAQVDWRIEAARPVGAAASAAPPAISVKVGQLQFSNADVGLAASAYLGGAVIGALFFGWLLIIGGIITSLLTLYTLMRAWNLSFWREEDDSAETEARISYLGAAPDHGIARGLQV